MAIQNVLEAVLNHYYHSSLPELSAVLNQYNVLAQSGTTDPKIYNHNGLLYQVLDAA